MSHAADVNDSTWKGTVLESDLPVLVDFWAEWCGPCRAMAPAVDKLAAEFNGKLRVVKMNTDENQETPARYGVTSIPTFLLVVKGKEVGKTMGSQSYDRLKALVQPHLKAAPAP
jgi:thioredoxin 1